MVFRRIAALLTALALLASLYLTANASTSFWPGELIGSDAAVSRGITGEGVVVGIIDSGLSDVFADHTDAQILQGVNYLAAEDDPDRHDVTDNVGHGTAVAAIIADRTIGLAPEVTLVPLKCFDKKTSTFAAITQAIYDAVDVFGCDVINLSLGSPQQNSGLAEAVQYALDQGVIVVAAVGNRTSYQPSTGSDPYFYPAAQDGVISVGAVNAEQVVTQASTQNDRLFLTAPGYQVPILTVDGVYTTGSGTSYAAPYVTAAAALALSADSELSSTTVSWLLQYTATDLGASGYDTAYGHGLLNLEALLAAMDSSEPLLQYDPDCGTISGYIHPDTTPTYHVFLTFYDAHGRFLGTDLHTDRSGSIVFSSDLPTGCTDFKCMVVGTSYNPILNAAHIKTTPP